jgi:hypothetical protein
MAYQPPVIKAGIGHTLHTPTNRQTKGKLMQTYVIRRRNAWQNSEELEAIAGLSMRIGNEEMADQVRWIRSYVVQEEDGSLGTVCIYQAVSAHAIREHARRVGMPADEITEVANTVVVRDDPRQTAAAA